MGLKRSTGPLGSLPARAPRVQHSNLSEYAPFPTFASRAGAWLVDLAVIFILAVASSFGWGLTRASRFGDQPPHGQVVLGVILGVSLAAAAVLYLPLCEGSGKGQTLGKRLGGLRVVRARDGQPLTLAHGFGRFFARVADLYSIGLIWAAVDTYGRAFHDHLAGTVVVDARRFPAAASSAASGNVRRGEGHWLST